MKYLKSYENHDVYLTPSIIKRFAQIIIDLISKLSNDSEKLSTIEYKLDDDIDAIKIGSIIGMPYTNKSKLLFIYFNKKSKKTIIHFNPSDIKYLEILKFIESIVQEYGKLAPDGYMIDHISELVNRVKKVTVEEFELFKDSDKYNL